MVLAALVVSLLVSAPGEVPPPEIERCGAGGRVAGEAPPDGFEQWCEAPDLYGRPARNGPYLAWYADGRVKHWGAYTDGLRHGVWRSYDQDGRLITQQTYEHGRMRVVDGDEPPPLPVAPPEREYSRTSTTPAVSPPELAATGEPETEYRKAWDESTVAVQVAMGLGALAVSALAGGGSGWLLADEMCASGPRGDPCRFGWAAGGFVLLYVPVSALAVYWGGSLMNGRGTLGSTFLGAAVNVLLLFAPVVGQVAFLTSASQIAAYHESASPKDPFFDGRMPHLGSRAARAPSRSLIAVDREGTSLDVPAVRLQRGERRIEGASVSVLSLSF